MTSGPHRPAPPAMRALAIAATSLTLLFGCTPTAARPALPPPPFAPERTATVAATVAAAVEATPVPPEEGDWAIANGGIRNTRARAGGFDPAAGETLAVEWEYALTSSGPYGYAAGAPAIVDGVVYVQSLGGDVTALELASGERLWRYDGGIPTAGPAGPAVASGRVYVTNGGARLQALEAATGKPLWTVPLEKDGYQPIVVGDTVIVGTGNQAHVGGNSGFVHAFNAANGARRWSFQVVEEGFWGNRALNSGGGVWSPPAVDLERRRVYVGTGNAGPYPGTRNYPNATSRPGPNLYTSALVALDVETGALDWYYQVVERGLFDHDFQSSPIVVDAVTSGTRRSLVIGAGKVGEVVAFDADTGRVVWRTAVGRHENDRLEAIPLGQAVLVYPGVFGGVETPMATDGHYVFVPVVNLPTRHTATGHGASDGSSALVNASEATSLSSGTGELVALDIATGALTWRQEFDSPVFGAATVWGDHVYTATYDGRIRAFDRVTGAQVWTYDAGRGINAWPAVSEEWMIWPIGLGPRPRIIAFHVAPPVTPTPTPGPPATP